MRRRVFLTSGSAAAVLALSGCGGGGSGASASTPEITSAAATTSPNSTLAPRLAADGQVAYPFGARIEPYAAGIKVNGMSNAEMDAALKGCYDAWKARALVDVPSVPGGQAVKFGNSTEYLTVSEGIGYGMLIIVLMAGHDPNAQARFNALFKTVRARPALGMAPHGEQECRYLMDWHLKMDGTSGDDKNLGANAADGDMDIAQALLMAHRQWGSGGEVNYLQEARNTINAMKKINMRPLGYPQGGPLQHVTRTSDHMIGHFRSYAAATGDSYWNRTAIDECYSLIDRMQTQFAPNTGLTPDFIINSDSTPIPSPGGFGDFTATEGFYFANACRNPWRWGTDYVMSGDSRWKNINNKLVNFIKQDCGGDPSRIGAGYRLDGTAMGRAYAPKGIIGPMICGAMVDASHQQFANDLFAWTLKNFTTDYFDSELMLIPMIVASGNWWNP
jgi:endoglucanase